MVPRDRIELPTRGFSDQISENSGPLDLSKKIIPLLYGKFLGFLQMIVLLGNE